MKKATKSGKLVAAPRLKTEADLIFDFMHGIEEKSHTEIAMQTPNFAVFRIKGHSAWAGVGCGREYVAAKYVLIRKGHWYMSNLPRREWEGRVSKEIMKEALRRSEMLKEPYMGDFQAPMCEECNEEMNYGQGEVRGVLVEYYSCDSCGWSVDV
jgi:hypothetical protein